MDSSKEDNEQIKSWYPIARKFEREYYINVYPSFLFFSPNGKIVDRWTSFQDPAGLVKIGKDALDPNYQIYTLIEKYKNRKLDYASMPYLANKANALGLSKRLICEPPIQSSDNKSGSLQMTHLADSIASDYINNYLFKSGRDSLFTLGILCLWEHISHLRQINRICFLLKTEIRLTP